MPLAALRSRRSVQKPATDDSVAREVGLQKLLSTRICDLTLKVEDVLFDCLAEVTSELRARGITFIPAYYLGDDDFWTADRATSINVPWYLANALLWQLVNDHLFEYSRDEVVMYLRHETGHAINYAFELWKRKDWAQTFGEFRRPYRDVYNPNPWSRDYVRYLHRAGMYHYAQKHPDEDFAETFAVWLDPSSRWRRRYKDWQVALAKLEYLDRIVDVEGACRGTPPNQRHGQRVGYETHQGNRRRLLRHQPRRGSRPGRIPPRPARNLPPALGASAQQSKRALGRPFHPAEPAHAGRQDGRMDWKVGSSGDQPFPAPTPGAVHLRAPGRAGKPAQRQTGGLDHRGHVARARRYSPTERRVARRRP
jgi:hypothetical protein